MYIGDKLKIAVITNGTLKDRNAGGHEMRIYQIFSRITLENEVHVVQVANNSEVWKLDGLIIHNLKPLPGRFGKSLYDNHFFVARYLFALRAGRTVKKIGPDIADYNSSVFPIFSKNYKMVATSTLMPIASGVSSTKGKIILALDKFLLRYKMGKSDFIIYLSRQMQALLADIQERYGKQSRYVPNGVDQTIFYIKEKHDCRKKRNLPSDKYLVMYSSRLVEYKRPFDFLNAVKSLPDKYIGVIVGDGPLMDKIRTWIMENQLGQRVIVTGKVEKETLADLYSACDIVVYPGEFEIQPLVPQESMACGTPPVVSNTLGNNEIVTDNENGLVVPLGDINAITDAIRKVCEDLTLRKKLNENGLNYMKNRNWDASSRITLEVYKNIVGK